MFHFTSKSTYSGVCNQLLALFHTRQYSLMQTCWDYVTDRNWWWLEIITFGCSIGEIYTFDLHFWVHPLISVLTTGQERTQQTRIFCGKTLLLTSSGAGAQNPKPQKRKPPSKRKRNPPSLFRRVILRLGRITPWLAAAHGRVDVTGKAEYM